MYCRLNEELNVREYPGRWLELTPTYTDPARRRNWFVAIKAEITGISILFMGGSGDDSRLVPIRNDYKLRTIPRSEEALCPSSFFPRLLDKTCFILVVKNPVDFNNIMGGGMREIVRFHRLRDTGGTKVDLISESILHTFETNYSATHNQLVACIAVCIPVLADIAHNQPLVPVHGRELWCVYVPVDAQPSQMRLNQRIIEATVGWRKTIPKMLDLGAFFRAQVLVRCISKI